MNSKDIITNTSPNLNPQSTNQSIKTPKSYQDWLDWLRKKQIKTGIRKHDKYDYDREDISNFYILENNLNGKKYEYQIAKDKAQNTNKFYNAKDITNQKGFLSTDRNHNPGSKENLSNIITDTSTNLNPQVANQTIQAPKSYQDWLGEN